MGFDQVQQVASQLRNQAFMLSIGFLLVTLIAIYWLLQRTLIAPLNDLKVLCHALASGNCDLSSRINFRKDNELGQLANAIDDFIAKWKAPLHLSKTESWKSRMSATKLSNKLVV